MKKNLLIPLFAAFVACTAPAGETAENLVYSLNAVIASKGEKFAVSDSTGKLHSGYVYDELEGLPNNFLLARQGEEYLILNDKGEKAGVRGYDTFVYCFNGCALVTADGKWGLVTTSGVEILQPESLMPDQGYVADADEKADEPEEDEGVPRKLPRERDHPVEYRS